MFLPSAPISPHSPPPLAPLKKNGASYEKNYAVTNFITYRETVRVRTASSLAIYCVKCFQNSVPTNCTHFPLFKRNLNMEKLACFSPVKSGNKANEILRSFAAELWSRWAFLFLRDLVKFYMGVEGRIKCSI